MHTTVARAIKPAWHAPAAPFPQKQRATALADRPAATEMITLQLGDFLDRIPVELLDEGTHDRSMPMPFDLAALSERIGRGDTTIRLTEVYRRMPDVFRPNAVIGQDRMIPFPWKKVLAMIREAKAGATEAGITRSGVDALAQKFKSRKLRQPSKTAPVPGAAGGAEAGGPGGLAKGGETPALTFSLARTGPAPTPPNPAETGRNGGLTASIMPASAAAMEVARLTAERDTALARAAEFGAEYESMIGRTGELTAERDAAVARAAELTAERDAAVARAAVPATEPEADAARLAELTAERDAAVARATKMAADSDAAVALAGEITAERDAVKNQVAEITAARDAADVCAAALVNERDAAVARGAELTTERDAANGCVAALTVERDAEAARAAALVSERDAAVARAAEVTAERDAAVARSAKLVADSDAAVALATEFTTERDAATARTAALNGQLDAAVARANEITAERDAAVARVAELLKISETRPQVASESSATDDSIAAIEGYRNTIEALMRERDALRMEQQQLTARLAERGSARSVIAEGKTKRPAPASEPLPDVYSALFPQRPWMQRTAAALLLGLLSIGVASQTDLGAARRVGAEMAVVASPGPAADFTIPALTPATIADGEFTLKSAAAEEVATTLLPEMPGGETPEVAVPFSGSPNPIVWKPITSRRAR